jgi:CDP-glucose 4,6-dehydratase
MAARFATFRGKRVLVTGHTGFTGSWMLLWLRTLGAEVTGVALAPDSRPSLYEEIGPQPIESHIVDLDDFGALHAIVGRARPDVVFHLAAQPLVRRSYREPVRTFMTNAIGTVHVLEACRLVGGVRAIVCVTTDKVYENREWGHPYREAAAEIVIASYRASFFSSPGTGAIASARGGNIIGGGDWAEDRLVPDFVRAVTAGAPLHVRYPDAVRPWQHVLALVDGYLTLAEHLIARPSVAATAWNLGPADPTRVSVRRLLEVLSSQWTAPDIVFGNAGLPESQVLQLDSTLARNELGWKPAWSTEQSLARTAEWYRGFYEKKRHAADLCNEQIDAWLAAGVAA